MYFCATDFVSFYDFSIGFKNSTVSVIFVGQLRQSVEWIRINMPGLERLHMDLKTFFILIKKVHSHPSWVL
jgi:hypothetical protein